MVGEDGTKKTMAQTAPSAQNMEWTEEGPSTHQQTPNGHIRPSKNPSTHNEPVQKEVQRAKIDT